jgi:hypothetical protein
MTYELNDPVRVIHFAPIDKSETGLMRGYELPNLDAADKFAMDHVGHDEVAWGMSLTKAREMNMQIVTPKVNEDGEYVR